MAMRSLDCRFSSPYPPHNRGRKIPATLLECTKTYSGSLLLKQHPAMGNAGWKIKQLAREQLRQPEVMRFIGRCISKSPQDFGMLLVSPHPIAIYYLLAEANRLQPDNMDAITRPAEIAIELMKIRNRLLFEGPRSAFAYLDASPKARMVRGALGDELHAIRMGLHEGSHFAFHPKTTALHETLKHRAPGRCLVLCESQQQAGVLEGIFSRSSLAQFSSDPSGANNPAYVHLVLFSPTKRLSQAIRSFQGTDVILLAMEGTWEEGAYWHYTRLEASLQAKQGTLGLDVPADRP